MTDWEEYSERHQFLSEEIPDLLLRYITRPEWRTFLDLGCGDGGLLYAANKLGYLNGRTVYAVDLSTARIESARSISSNFSCFVDDACNLKNIPSDSIDLLASMQVIEHVPDDLAMIKEIARVVRTNGRIYLSTVYKTPGAMYVYRNQGRMVIDPTHVREYTSDSELIERLLENGFVVEHSVKTRIMRPVVGFTILSRLGAPKDIILRSPIIKFLHKLKFPVPGYFIWEIVAVKT